MFVLKNRSYPQLSEANFHARLCHLKHLLKEYYWRMMLTTFCSLVKRYLQWPRRKTRRMTNCTYNHQPRRKTSWQNASAHN